MGTSGKWLIVKHEARLSRIADRAVDCYTFKRRVSSEEARPEPIGKKNRHVGSVTGCLSCRDPSCACNGRSRVRPEQLEMKMVMLVRVQATGHPSRSSSASMSL